MKKKTEDNGPSKEAVFKAFTEIMLTCDESIDEVIRDDWADITDMSGQVVNVMMAIEFAYICYRNRLKVFMESLNDAAGMEVFDEDALRDIVDYARVSLQPMLKSIMVSDKKMFKESLEVVPVDEEIDADKLINVRTRGKA